MANIHNLKTLPPFFFAVARGEKTFEVREDDRSYQTGDIVILEFFEASKPNWSPPMPPAMPGNAPPYPIRLPPPPPNLPKVSFDRSPIYKRISYVLRGGQFGIEPGFVVFGLEEL